MKKVLQLVYDLNCGGVEAFVTNLNSCEKVFENPFDFLLFTKDEEEQFFEAKNKKRGSEIIKIVDDGKGSSIKRFIKRRKQFYNVVKNGRYDVVHIHKETISCMIEAIIAKLAGANKVIVHSHNTHVARTGKKAVIEEKLHKIGRMFWKLCVDQMCACSTEAGIWLFGERNIKRNDVEILKNGIIGSNYYFNPEIRKKYREKLGWNDKKIIGHVGRFSEQKNHRFLIEIIAEMYKKDENIRAILFGVGDLREEIKNKVKEMGLEEVIIFPGTSPEINNWLQAIDLFLFPSLYEGLPVAGIEAQATGVEILASDTISTELKITQKIHWMPLKEPANKWAVEGLKLMELNTCRDTAEDIQKAGYDIEFTAKRIKEIYES